MNPPRYRTRRRINALSVAKMMRAMQDGPMSMRDLAEEVGLGMETVRSYVLTLHAQGVCYIAEWEQDRRGAYMRPAFRLGAKKDREKPAPMSSAALSKEWRMKQRQRELLATFAGPLPQGVT